MKMKFWIKILLQTEKDKEAWEELVPEGFMEHFTEYVKTFSRLAKPNMRDQLIILINLWDIMVDHFKLLKELDPLDKKYHQVLKRTMELSGRWNLVMTRMGLTLTAQSYISKEEREELPIPDLMKMQDKMEKITKKFNGNLKKLKKRQNPGGERRVEPILIKKKKKEKKSG